MKIRLHLVRFMYINLILSCCFWLYDNAAAAEVPAINAAAASNENGVAERAGARKLLPTAFAAPHEENETSDTIPSTNFQEKKTIADAVAADGRPAVTAASTAATPTSAHQEAENVVKKLPISPRTSAKSLPAALIDTSVNVNVLPSIVNTNSNNQYDSVVRDSEKVNTGDESEATAKLPKNQFNDKTNDNSQINTNIDVNQVDQLQQPNLVDDAAKPTPAHEQQVQQQQQQQQQHHQQKMQQQQQQQAQQHKTQREEEKTKQSLPEIINEQLPAVTSTDLRAEVVEHVKERLEAVVSLDTASSPSNRNESQQQLGQGQPLEGGTKEAPNAELNINDPGGGLELHVLGSIEASNGMVSDEGQMGNSAPNGGSNATAEEIPMPVFSEWAQKQIEAEASREQAMELEQQVVNNSAQRRNATGSASGKPPTLKLRAKNYASPDCGAKIIASNADATNTGAVLSHSSDEYMLSTCGSRIWFVVELCEAVQAQKVELANFELFSSSPKNFTVAVSKRFPTRDWSNVGRFAAEDKRTVQTFELHPHLFGKFVRVDIHSHYSKEHFCPISLFRVFGTSEFEAFETEIRHSDELDDFDDDFGGQEQPHKAFPGTAGAGANIFQSASDAVIQMVKKAAQVLAKPTKALRWSGDSQPCYTPAAGVYSCQGCNSSFVDRVNHLLCCQSRQIELLLLLPQLRNHFLHTRVCQLEYNISISNRATATAGQPEPATSGMDQRQSFYLCMLPVEHVGALCKLLQAESRSNLEYPAELQETDGRTAHLEEPEQSNENVTTPVHFNHSALDVKTSVPTDSSHTGAPSLEMLPAEMSAATELPAGDTRLHPQPTDGPAMASAPSDVNIFNVPGDLQKDAAPALVPCVLPDTATSTATLEPASASASASTVEPHEMDTLKMPPSMTANHQAASSGEADSADLVGSGSGLEDANLANWESIDSLLTTTVASITAGGGAAAAAAAVVNGNANMGGVATAGAAAAAGAAGSQNLQPKLTHGPQSESVFIRLSNRIKALERNMSLSGQYLEELSRRYKKQVEELQQTLTQQSLTVRALEDQSRRYMEQEQLYQRQSAELAGDVRALTYQVQACILVIIIVGTCIFLMLVVGTIYYHKLRRQTQQLLPLADTGSNAKQQLSRRKSHEEPMQQSPGKQRRPSEEAMLILNACGDSSLAEKSVPGTAVRKRKISVCYGTNNNIAAQLLGTKASLQRRKSGKHSWHASLDSAPVSCSEQDKFFDVDTLKSSKILTKPCKKRSLQLFEHELKRQESAPGSYAQGCLVEEPPQSDFDESLILDDEDLCNFIPNSDLAYNEFMPEGPSGYHILDTVDGKTEKAQTSKKSRRVSSPAFFKSPFSKNKSKGTSFNGIGGVKSMQTAHEATSWEWYRLRRNEKQQKQATVPSASDSPNASLDSSSLSEINFPFNSTQNSFRILGEAILSSGESRVGGKASTVAAGSSSSSGASTTSSTTKKKQRAFNNIFRKVF